MLVIRRAGGVVDGGVRCDLCFKEVRAKGGLVAWEADKDNRYKVELTIIHSGCLPALVEFGGDGEWETAPLAVLPVIIAAGLGVIPVRAARAILVEAQG